MTDSQTKNTPQDQQDELDKIMEKYGYFLGLGYEDEKGNLATHKAGKVRDEILLWHNRYINKACNEAKIDELELLSHTKFSEIAYDIPIYLKDRIKALKDKK